MCDRSMNHRLRGYSNPDDLVDSQSQHYHHYGHAEPLASQSSQDIKGEQPEDSICVRCFSTLVAFFSKQQVRNDEMAGDEQTRYFFINSFIIPID